MSRRDEVLEAALELLDEVGLDALTTRRLAERLGVRPSALYRHFASKRLLLDAMVEHIAARGAAPAAPHGDWTAQIHSAAGNMREAMLAYRDGARLMATFVEPGPAAQASWNWFTGVARSAGASRELAELAVDTLTSYVQGFTIEEQARKSGVPRARRDKEFRAGLDLIITGIKASFS
ncbi:MAG TPA: TetR/AcrR family transcriptional regulator C-terminal domain-containing protein [Amycolatopsis sp.]|uniref:TetR/AcrR family transcriptional regulator C-terminal domain-containing protein n=1 Tax=Amycolatopsis sp. TaxID=37632 RepID=UPI002B49C892|nr:TetR/AcrR family transcriptional regulator C-terminal domain-containing protein [Amycolatopsis sp.]HKS44381.1 TetR/AcrR family transcriptional regulator C-terminal domain-containing protein [Amycolatopsis sp.]